MEAVMTTINKKSGKGISDGVISELTAIFGVKPGHEEDLRAACAAFAEALRSMSPEKHQKTGLRDSRHVIFDNGRRLLWATTFETDWDPYMDDAVQIIGVQHFIAWMKYVVEADELTAWLESAGGSHALSSGDTEEVGRIVSRSGSGLKAIIQSVQSPAVGYFNVIPDWTIPEIRKAVRVEEAFERVLDDPTAEQALRQPVLKPLLHEASG